MGKEGFKEASSRALGEANTKFGSLALDMNRNGLSSADQQDAEKFFKRAGEVAVIMYEEGFSLNESARCGIITSCLESIDAQYRVGTYTDLLDVCSSKPFNSLLDKLSLVRGVK